jgi:hypothetical protein
VSIKDRIKKLELMREAKTKSQIPRVVEQKLGETLEEALERAFQGVVSSEPISCIVVPAKLTEEEWVERYSPPPVNN